MMTSKMRQPINIAFLESWLASNFSEILPPIHVSQFTFGQSNPTYLVTSISNGARYVLRKKPTMKLVSKKVHWIERECFILKSLENTGLPVPKVYCLCSDDSVIGTPFYIMEYLDGRIFEENHLPGVAAEDLHEMFKDAVRILARLHCLHRTQSLSLESYGQATEFWDRQTAVITAVTKAQAKIKDQKTRQPVGPIPHSEELITFFQNRKRHPREMVSIVHGDFKIDNIVFHKTEPRVIGILDWEMSTLGHPISDLTHLLTGQVLASAGCITAKTLPFFGNNTPGMPSADQVLGWYRDFTGWDARRDFPWASAFDCFKCSVICQGIKTRIVTGQHESVLADEWVHMEAPFAETARKLIAKIVEKEDLGIGDDVLSEKVMSRL